MGVPGSNDVVHRQPEDLAQGRRRSLSLVDRAAEEQLEPRAGRPEVGGRRERDVHLHASGKQEDPVDRRAMRQVEKVNALNSWTTVCVQSSSTSASEELSATPKVRSRSDQRSLAPADRPAHGRGRDDTRIGAGQFEQALPHTLSLLDREDADHRDLERIARRTLAAAGSASRIPPRIAAQPPQPSQPRRSLESQ